MKETVQQAAALIAKNVPTKIFLQIGDDGDLPEDWDFKDSDVEYVTWCANRINETDIEYVLAGHAYAGEGMKPTSNMQLKIGRLEVNCFDEDGEMSIRIGNSKYQSLNIDQANEVAHFFNSHIQHESEANGDESPSDAVESEAVAKAAKVKLIWEMIEEWQASRDKGEDTSEPKFSYNDIEVELYRWFEIVDPKNKTS